jgi:hypothetical protein
VKNIAFRTALVLALPFACLAQVPENCTSKVITPVTANVSQRLQNASALTNSNDKQSAMRDARLSLSQTLTSATTFAACLGASAQSKSLAAVLEVRHIDKQTGAASSGAGSTNLTSSGSVPALLGLALEYGGLTEAFNGTTATFSTTPAKLAAAAAKAYGPDTKPPSDATLRALQRVSLSISFDTSRTDTATMKNSSLVANYQQLSQASARLLLWNDRDPFAAKNWQQILDLARSASAQDEANMAAELLAPVTKIPSYDQALDNAMKAYDDLVAKTPTPDASTLTPIITGYIKDVSAVIAVIPDWKQRVDRYVTARLKVDGAQKKLYDKLAKAPTLTFNYVLSRPPLVSGTTTTAAATATTMVTGTLATPATAAVQTPDLSAGTLIFTASMLSTDITLNASANFFDSTLPSMKGNFRDFQFSGKWDIPVGGLPPFLSKGTLTFSGLYEHLHQKPLGIDLKLNDQTVNQPGDMGVFQIKYSIPVGDSGVSVPISFTTSNRTELVKEKDNRGNIGITFDLDKLFAKQ